MLSLKMPERALGFANIGPASDKGAYDPKKSTVSLAKLYAQERHSKQSVAESILGT